MKQGDVRRPRKQGLFEHFLSDPGYSPMCCVRRHLGRLGSPGGCFSCGAGPASASSSTLPLPTGLQGKESLYPPSARVVGPPGDASPVGLAQAQVWPTLARADSFTGTVRNKRRLCLSHSVCGLCYSSLRPKTLFHSTGQRGDNNGSGHVVSGGGIQD